MIAQRGLIVLLIPGVIAGIGGQRSGDPAAMRFTGVRGDEARGAVGWQPGQFRIDPMGTGFEIYFLSARYPWNVLAVGRYSEGARQDQQVELAELLSMAPAKQKCENWAWAAAVESILRAQKVPLAQSYWVTKADGGEVCKESATDLNALPKLINGSYVLDDGRKVRLVATLVAGAPAEMHRDFHAADPVHHLIDHLHRKRRGGIGVGIFSPHLRVDEEAEMRVVDLHDVRTGIAHDLDRCRR